ncbi:hypothetical protein ACFO25_05340 [Paenactinomyces guangxiensis]|uniref:Uncharacterized protein n=1 Tax=Paenactinomyces guangxiensis TaxID=1490290 RepID=A0A7W2A8Y6_9BACL|nr:hypothetical protein [Paenactinomyces guangxiensis]MBA4494343.1 hypothetical protein [Paenactinomyces guangxiensis]MBH8590838.1 hypothetical protein [Paenactinomyces guangxiensis]
MGNHIGNNKTGDRLESNMEPELQDKNQTDKEKKGSPRRRRSVLRSCENRPKKKKNKRMNK